MNKFDLLIAKNLSSDFNDWHDAILGYDDIDSTCIALYEAASRHPSMSASLSYGALTRLLGYVFDTMRPRPGYNAKAEKSLAGYVYRTFGLLSAMDAAHSDMKMTSTFSVRSDIIQFLDNFVLSHS